MNSIFSYGQVLQEYLNANISPQGLSLITKTTDGATHALSISPILVIDDNPFLEGLYNEFKQPCNTKCKGCKRTNPYSLKPSKSLPHWHRFPKWVKNWEGQYNKSSPIKCAFLKLWVKSNAHIQWRIHGGRSNYIEDPKDCKRISKRSKQTGSKNMLKKIRGNSPRYMHKVGFTF